MRTAIVHYWLLNMRGGEKVLESLCRVLPDADIFTLFYEPEYVSATIRSHNVTPSFLNPFRRHYRSMLPLMPLALEHFDLRRYDLILSSESGPAKGVLTSANSLHICYCHTPMRYLWELYPTYVHEWTTSRTKRAFIAPLATYLRLWDYASAARVDQFIANSENVRRRIWKTYRREAEVVYPGVPTDEFYYQQPEDYYMVVSELVAYKRIDSAVRVCSETGRRLRVVGDGPEFRNLKAMAGASIEFCGHVTDRELRQLYARCRAFLMPGEEDLGLTAIEALASGKAVIALGRGGVLETVPTAGPQAGVFYEDPEPEQLLAAIEQFEAVEHDIRPRELQSVAARFSESAFRHNISAVLAHHGVRLTQEVVLGV